MFNKEAFINKYVEVLSKEKYDDSELSALVQGLPKNGDSSFYEGVINELIFSLQGEEGEVFNKEVKRLENTVAMMKFMEELSAQDSNTVEAKDNTEAEKVTQDVTADSAAVVSEGEVAVEETATNSKEKADGDAPAEEVKAEKSESEGA